MNMAEILKSVPGADPVFVKIMQKVPEPPHASRSMVLQRLPELHRIFLEKRRIAALGDEKAWQEIIKKEAALVRATL